MASPRANRADAVRRAGPAQQGPKLCQNNARAGTGIRWAANPGGPRASPCPDFTFFTNGETPRKLRRCHQADAIRRSAAPPPCRHRPPRPVHPAAGTVPVQPGSLPQFDMTLFNSKRRVFGIISCVRLNPWANSWHGPSAASPPGRGPPARAPPPPPTPTDGGGGGGVAMRRGDGEDGWGWGGLCERDIRDVRERSAHPEASKNHTGAASSSVLEQNKRDDLSAQQQFHFAHCFKSVRVTLH